MSTIAAPANADETQRRNWGDKAESVFRDFLSMSMGLEKSPLTEKQISERTMLDYYNSQVKDTKVVVKKTGSESLGAVLLRKAETVRKVTRPSK